MIRRENGVSIMTCDVCEDETIEGEYYYDVAYDAKDAGWKTVREGREWRNIGPACQEEGK